MKTCRHCGEAKEPGDFRRNRSSRDGLSSWWAACHREASRRWHRENSKRVAAKRRTADTARLKICQRCGGAFIAPPGKWPRLCAGCTHVMLELWGDNRHRQIELFGEKVLPHFR